MGISYKKLWKLLIDLDMNQEEFIHASGLSRTIISKMKRGMNIRSDTIGKICEALDCQPGDIMEYNSEKSDKI